jgi:diguanylate cyclase (GGDEF)-like protein
MPSLDLFTLACVTIVNLLISSTAMYCVALLNRQRSGIRDCAIGGFIVAAAFFLSLLRSLSPNTGLNLVSNLMIVGGTLLLLEGIRSFRGMKPLKPGLTLGGFALFAALFALWLYRFDSVQARTILASLALALLFYWCAYCMASHAEHGDRWVYWATGGIYAVHATALFLRGIHAFGTMPGPSVFTSASIDLLSVLTANLASMAGAFGLALATNLALTRQSEKLARYDPLTNLPNRRLFEERLDQAQRKVASTGGSLALIYCDLDEFKSVNDTFGHEAGDNVLRVIADRLRQSVPAAACLARVGGDEFLMLMEKPPAREELLALVASLRDSVEQPIEVSGQTLALKTVIPKISCGMAAYPADVRSMSDLVRQADAAMYAMKQRGRASAGITQMAWQTSAGSLASE